MALKLETVAIDARDPVALGRWWADFLGGTHDVDEDDDPEVAVEVDGYPTLLFLRVPDGKSVKNRLHLDLRPDDQAAEVARAESMGATRVDIGQGEQTWVVLADPEGNEFCILRVKPAED
jgi:hypothetical protein